MAVLDRSWYGRVLVERIEGFATEEQWSRAYQEIVTFEASKNPLKSWKLTDEDGATGRSAPSTRWRSRTC
jgi:polyphosphate kinase 2 (PPK2 family)